MGGGTLCLVAVSDSDTEGVLMGVLFVLVGIGAIVYASYVNGNRLVFKDWVIYRYRGSKELWKMPIAELTEISSVEIKDQETYAILESRSGETHRVSYVAFRAETEHSGVFGKGSRKLRLMLTDPERGVFQAFQNAHPDNSSAAE